MTRMDGRGSHPAGRGRRLAPLAATVSIAIVLVVGLAQVQPYGDAGPLPQAADHGYDAEPFPWVQAWHPPVLQEAYADHLTVCGTALFTGQLANLGFNDGYPQIRNITFAVPDGTYGPGEYTSRSPCHLPPAPCQVAPYAAMAASALAGTGARPSSRGTSWPATAVAGIHGGGSGA